MKTIPIFGTGPEHRELRELLAGTPDKYEARKVARFFCKYSWYQHEIGSGYHYARRAILDTSLTLRTSSLLCKIVGIEP